MAWDLAIGPHGDLLFAGNRDLTGVGGHSLTEQRIRLRCKIPRGSWVYDEPRTLGSNLWKLLGVGRADVIENVDPYVREALTPMGDISVEDVLVVTDGHEDHHDHVHVEISYKPILTELEAAGLPRGESFTTVVTI